MEAKRDASVFVKLDEYNEAREIIRLLRQKLREADYILSNVKELKKKEENEIDTLSSELSKVEEKINTIEKTMSEPQV